MQAMLLDGTGRPDPRAKTSLRTLQVTCAQHAQQGQGVLRKCYSGIRQIPAAFGSSPMLLMGQVTGLCRVARPVLFSQPVWSPLSVLLNSGQPGASPSELPTFQSVVTCAIAMDSLSPSAGAETPQITRDYPSDPRCFLPVLLSS